MIASLPLIDSTVHEKIEKLASNFQPFANRLEQNKPGKVVLDGEAISTIIAAAYCDKIKDASVDLDFTIFKEFPVQMQFLTNYFKSVVNDRRVEFERVVMNEFPDWENETDQLIDITTTTLKMESIDATLIDFANKYIGGGVLEGGCVQEEILFMCRPECIAARYFTEPLLDNEALIIRNPKVYSGYDGYGPSLEYKEYANECYECDVIAIDASYYKWRNSRLEFTKESILREVNKAYTGFLYSKGKIVTGNWG